MLNPKPEPFNVVADDPTGNTWALPEGAIARFGKGAHSRNSNLGDVALSPDGSYFVAGTGTGLWWYDVPTMLPIALWETERGLISAVDISSDGKLIATANWDGIVKVLDVQSGECLTKMKRSTYLRTTFIALSPDSKSLATGISKQGKIEIFDTQSGECLFELILDVRKDQWDSISQLTFSPNSEILAVTWKTPVESHGGIVSVATHAPQTYLYDTETGKQVAKFNGGEFTFSPDSKLLAYVSVDETNNDVNGVCSFVSVREIETGEGITCFKQHDNSVKTIIFSQCSKFVASGDSGGTLRVWELATGVEKLVSRYNGFSKNTPKNWIVRLLRRIFKKTDSKNAGQIMPRVEPFYSAEGTLYSAVLPHGTQSIEVWNVELHKKLQTYERQTESIGDEWLSKCPELAITHTLLNKKDRTDGTYTFLSLRDPTCYPEPIVFSPDGRILASSGVWNGITLWDIESKETHTTLVIEASIDSFTFLLNGNLLIAHRYNENTYHMWELGEPYKLIGKFSISGLVSPIVFAPTGDRIAMTRVNSNKERSVYIWNLESDEKIIDTGHKDYIPSMMFSSDGNLLVTGSWNGIAQLWDVNIGEEIAATETSDTIRAITFSPCGNLIAGGIQGEVRIWNTDNLGLIRTIQQSEHGEPYALAFSPCGRYLASGTWWQKGMEKMAIRLWDVATGENIHTFWGHTTDVQSLAFSPDGMLLASGGFDGTILLWDLTPFIDT